MSCHWHERLKEAWLRVRAKQYAKTLRPGSTILNDTDGDYIAEFQHLIPAALAERNLYLESLADGSGWVVRASGSDWEGEVTQPAPVLPVPTGRTVCRCCRGDVFACDHQAQWDFPGSHVVRPQSYRTWGRA